MNTDYKNLLVGFEELIRLGDLRVARERLLAEKSWHPPRALLAEFANIARRCGLPTLSLKLLQPVIYPKFDRGDTGSARERSIYAAALAAIGALGEARLLIAPIADEVSPEVQLYSGFVHVHRWDYAAAIPFFEKYLTLDGPNLYQNLVAQLNLGSCLSFLQQSPALLILSEKVLSAAQAQGWHLHSRDATLLATQSLIQQNEFTSAQAMIDRGLRICADHKLDDLLLQKWQLILELSREGRTRKTLMGLSELRKTATERRRYEILRDCDYYQGLLATDRALLNKSYVGSPFPSYRGRIESEARGLMLLNPSYRQRLGQKPGRLLDLEAGKINGAPLGDGSALRVLRALAADFYRPIKIGGLFSELYPDEIFDAVHSPARVRTALTRTRRVLAAHGIPLQLLFKNGEYELHADRPCDLLVKIDYEEVLRNAVNPAALHRLKNEWPYKTFSLSEASNVLDLSREKTRRLLGAAHEKQRLFTSGSGRTKRFRFAK